MPKKKKKLVPNGKIVILADAEEGEIVPATTEGVAEIIEEPTPEPEVVEEELEPIPEPVKKKRVDYKQTIKFSTDRFGNPRSQRDFESTLRNFLDAEEAYKAWQAWITGGTVTLVLKH